MPGQEILLHSLQYGPGFTQLVKPGPPAAGAGFQRKVDGFAWERMIGFTMRFTASATVAFRALDFQVQDGDGFVIMQLPLLSNVTATDVRSVYGGLNAPVAAPGPESGNGYGTAAAPAANTAIASVVGMQPGQYLVNWIVEVSGTLAAGTDNDNMQVVDGTDPILRAEFPAAAGSYPQNQEIITLASGVNVSVKSVGAATAGSTYTATIVLTPVSAQGNYFQLPLVLVKAGWSFNVIGANLQAADQIDQLGLLLERYNEPIVSGTDQYEDYYRFMAWMRAGMPAGGG